MSESVCACIKEFLLTEIENNTNSWLVTVKNDLTHMHQKIKMEKTSQAFQCHLETVGRGVLDSDT